MNEITHEDVMDIIQGEIDRLKGLINSYRKSIANEGYSPLIRNKSEMLAHYCSELGALYRICANVKRLERIRKAEKL